MISLDIEFSKPYKVGNTEVIIKGRYKTYPGQMESDGHIHVELYGMPSVTQSHRFKIVMGNGPIIYSISDDNYYSAEESDFGLWLKGVIVGDYTWQQLTRKKGGA